LITNNLTSNMFASLLTHLISTNLRILNSSHHPTMLFTSIFRILLCQIKLMKEKKDWNFTDLTNALSFVRNRISPVNTINGKQNKVHLYANSREAPL